MLSDVNHLFPTVVSVPPAGHIQASHDLFAHLSGRGFSLFDPMLAWRFSSVGAQHDIKKLSAETGLTEIGVQDWISVIRMHAHGLRSDWIPLVAPLGRVRRQARTLSLTLTLGVSRQFTGCSTALLPCHFPSRSHRCAEHHGRGRLLCRRCAHDGTVTRWRWAGSAADQSAHPSTDATATFDDSRSRWSVCLRRVAVRCSTRTPTWDDDDGIGAACQGLLEHCYCSARS